MNDHPLASDPSCLSEIIAGYLEATACGQVPDRTALLATHPDLADELRDFFADHDKMTQAAAPLRSVLSDAPSPTTETFPHAFGDYELLEEIGRGGMGVVYRARQVRLNRVVALKRIRAGQLASPEDVARFRREAEAAAGLDHPNIVPIYEVGEHAGHHYFTMKLIDGGNLNAHLKRFADARATAELMIKIARAVHHAHQRGILHRDLKPGNILIDADGQPHVGDFGLAQSIEKEAKLTQSGAIVGTAEYMAPEQARGARGLTTAADVYGLGAIQYVLLTGQPPFQGDYTWETLKKVVEEEPVLPSSINRTVNRDLEAICLACLEKSAAKRYASAEALAAELENWQLGKPISVRRTGVIGRAVKWGRRRPAMAAFVATAAVLLATVAVGAPVVAVREGILLEAADDALKDAIAARKEADIDKAAALNLAKELGEQKLISDYNAKEADKQRKTADQKTKDALDALEQVGLEKAKAVEQFHRARSNLFSAQLMRISSLIHRDPDRAFELLHDYEACPIDLRDFAWRFHAGLCARRTLKLPLAGEVACFSPDGKFVAVARYHDENQPKKNGEVYLLEASSGKLLATLKADAYRVTSLAFSPDNKILVAAYTHRSTYVPATKDELTSLIAWDISGTKPKPALERQLRDIKLRAKLATFSADGKSLFVAGRGPARDRADQFINRVDLSTGEVKESSLKTDPVAFSADGSRLVAMRNEKGFLVHDVQTGKQIGSEVKNDGRKLAISSDGLLVATGSSWGDITINEVATGKQRLAFKAHLSGRSNDGPDSIEALAFGLDDATLFSVSSSAMKNWDVRTGELLATLKQSGNVSLALSPDGQTLLTAGGSRATLWNLSRDGAFKSLRDFKDFTALAASPDGKTIAAMDKKRIRLIDPFAGTERILTTLTDVPLVTPRFLPGGKKLLVGKSLWDVAEGKLERTFDAAPTFSPDGHTYATWHKEKDGWILWNAATQEEKAFWPRPASPDVGSIVLGNGSLVAIVRSKRTPEFEFENSWQEDSAEVWDREKNELVATFKRSWGVKGRPNAGWNMQVAFSPDGKHLLMKGLNDSAVLLCELAPKKQQLLEHAEGLSHAQFSPDSKHVVTLGYHENGVKVWNALTGTLLRVLAGARPPVAFSPGGEILATVAEDGRTGKLWDMASGQLRVDLTGHIDVISTIVFDPQGNYLTTRSNDGTLKVWLGVSPTVHTVIRGFEDGLIGSNGFVASSHVSADGTSLAGFDSPHGRYTIYNPANPPRFPDRLHLFDLKTGQPRTAPFENTIRVSAFSPDVADFAYCHEGFVKIWDIKAAKLKHAVQRSNGKSGYPDAMQFSPDSASLLTIYSDGHVNVWNVATGKVRISETSVNRMTYAFRADGKRLIFPDKTHVGIWDLEIGAKCAQLDSPRYVKNLCYSPDGRFVVTWGAASWSKVGSGHVLELWEAATGKHKSVLMECAEPKKLVFSADGKTLAALVDKAYMFDVESGKPLKAPEEKWRSSRTFAFRRDGLALAIGDHFERAILLWDVAKGEGQRLPLAHPARWMDYSPGGKILVCYSGNEIHILDAATHRVRGVLYFESSNFTFSFVGNDRLFHGDGGRRHLVLDLRAAIDAYELFGIREHSTGDSR